MFAEIQTIFASDMTRLERYGAPSNNLVQSVFWSFHFQCSFTLYSIIQYIFCLYVYTVASMLETQEYTLRMPWPIQQSTSLEGSIVGVESGPFPVIEKNFRPCLYYKCSICCHRNPVEPGRSTCATEQRAAVQGRSSWGLARVVTDVNQPNAEFRDVCVSVI